MRKIVDFGTIYKPKIERLSLQAGCKPDDLKDFVGPREFLQRYKGVKQKKDLHVLNGKRADERQARTFQHAGIEVMTAQGLVTLTRELANELKEEFNNSGYKASHYQADDHDTQDLGLVN